MLKEKRTVNVGAANIYIEIYHKYNPETNERYDNCVWKIGDTTFEIDGENRLEKVFDGEKWLPTQPTLSTSISSYFFRDIEEASEYILRIMNNDPEFDEQTYLNGGV